MNNFNFYKYIDDISILIINQNGNIKRLNCPFAVKNKEGKLSVVTAISTGNDGKIYYKIKGTFIIYSFYSICNAS